MQIAFKNHNIWNVKVCSKSLVYAEYMFRPTLVILSNFSNLLLIYYTIRSGLIRIHEIAH
jgi:hypothetical protein